MNKPDTFEHVGEIAIVGMACRFPMAKNPDEFWDNLRNGVEAVTFFSDEELLASGVDPATLANPRYVKAQAVLPDIELFDADLFNINPREAELIDPQQRIFLECAWEALENAGYNSETYAGRIGVYAGGDFNTYLFYNLYSHRDDLLASFGVQHTKFSSEKDYLATRVCYKMNLRGPGVTIQTASSASLVAVHIACQSLLVGESDMALAGGVSINAQQKLGYFYAEGGINSDDGHCRAFDAKARGTVGGNGVGIVVLKRLEDALRDGDSIHAVIKGSAINNDGSAKVGFTAPSVEGQANVIAEALAVAGVRAEEISYVEAHGSGTNFGDPIEVAALTRAFGDTRRRQFCGLGSVKTNIGHTNMAAGAAALIKTTLALKHGMLPPSLNFDEPNPNIDFANSPFYVNSKLSLWETGATPRRAGVSNFGIGGTNAHVILEEAPARESQVASTSKAWQLLVLSAKTETALEQATTNLVEHLKRHAELRLTDVAYTLQVGRRAFGHRRMVVCRDVDDAIAALETRDPKRVLTSTQEASARQVFFMFPGLGDHYVGMAAELYEREPTFRHHVDECCRFLKSRFGLDVLAALYPSSEQTAKRADDDEAVEKPDRPTIDLRRMLRRNDEQTDEATRKLNQTQITQPALFVIEYALAQVWMERGVSPRAFIGYSLGEYVAACLAGVFTVEEALKLVAARAQMIAELPEGAMLAVPLPESEVRPLLNDALSLAAVNAPEMCVVAGTAEAVHAMEEWMKARGLPGRRMQISHAFHSSMMEPIREAYTALVKTVSLKPPHTPFVSTVTGTWINDAEATDAAYWGRHMCLPVRFADGVRVLLEEPRALLLEVGPGLTLGSLARQQPEHDGTSEHTILSSLRHSYERQSDITFMQTALGKLWLDGVEIDWHALPANEPRRRVPLPTYPFERQRYWIEPKEEAHASERRDVVPHKKPHVADWFYLPCWKESPLPPPAVKNAQADKKSHCLLFVDDDALGIGLSQRLADDGHLVTTVRRGEEFARKTPRHYQINPHSPEDYHALIATLATDGETPQSIIHLWSHTTPTQQTSVNNSFDELQQRGFYSLIFLARSLERASANASVQIAVVSNELHNLMGEQVVCPDKATLLGACKVIRQEHPNLNCRSIDISVAGTPDATRTINQIVGEAWSEASDLVITYRGNRRWVQTFEPIYLAADERDKGRLREHGSYLLTGGLSEAALSFAQYLAAAVRAKLTFVGRNGLPPRDEWEAWCASHDERDATSRRIQKVSELERHGAEVLLLEADISDASQMSQAIAQSYAHFGMLHGVIQTFDSNEETLFSTINEIETGECAEYLDRRVRGLRALESALSERELDFCFLQSSVSSVLGGVGVVAHAAANNFTDAFAQRVSQTGPTTWTSIIWERWRFADDKHANLTAGSILDELTLSPAEATQALARLLSYDAVPQAIVSTGDFNLRMEQWIAPHVQKAHHAPRADTAGVSHQRPALQNPYVAPGNEVEERIASIWEALLGVEDIGVYDNFFELGGHSLLGTQLITRLREVFQVDMRLRHLFESPTVAAMSLLVEELIIENVEELTEEEAANLL